MIILTLGMALLAHGSSASLDPKKNELSKLKNQLLIANNQLQKNKVTIKSLQKKNESLEKYNKSLEMNVKNLVMKNVDLITGSSIQRSSDDTNGYSKKVNMISKVFVDGKEIDPENTINEEYLLNLTGDSFDNRIAFNNLYIPIEYLPKILNYTIIWDQNTKTMTLTKQ